MTAIDFRPLRLDDLPLLERWLSMPHVDAWWHEPLDLAGVRAKYVPGIEGTEPIHVFVIGHGARPIGWIQWYRWADYPEHAALLGAGPESAGIDLAIGEAELIGVGVGSRAIRAFVDSIVFADPAITACVTDPDVRNDRSCRAFEKAGFTTVGTVQLPGESSLRRIMRREAAFSP